MGKTEDSTTQLFKQYLDERFRNVNEKLDDLAESIKGKGNGKKGLIERVDDIERRELIFYTRISILAGAWMIIAPILLNWVLNNLKVHF